MTRVLTKRDVEMANQEFHRRFADRYDEDNQHIGGPNFQRVHDDIHSALGNRPAGRLVDLGTGTGFMLRVCQDLCSELIGVDFTAEISRLVPEDLHARVLIENTERTSIEPASADLITAYSFLHHLFDLEPTLREAHRILRPGGALYAGMDPNKRFWDFLKTHQDARGNPIIERESRVVTRIEKVMEDEAGIEPEITAAAEYQKIVLGGFEPAALQQRLEAVGFVDVRVRHDWFFGEAFARSELGDAVADGIARHLSACLPATSHLFKYLTVFARKPC
jgi:ubiquinone/menaquinone biosynthesis C-methylase UbiE